jgi:predicted anti-sigma-YlaC factor YlaD
VSEDSLRCRFVVQLLTEYLEDALSSETRARVTDHLAGCDACSAFLDQLQKLIRATGAVDEEQLSPTTKNALLNQFRDWYDEQRSAPDAATTCEGS